MTALREVWARFLSSFHRRELDRDFDEELASHTDLAIEEYVRRGMSPDEARRQARIRLGGVETSKELHRETRGLRWLEEIRYDLRHALRGLWRDRLFTATAIATLAITIGLNVTAFALANTMLFRGFPMVRRNDRLLYMQERNPLGRCCISYADFDDWRKQAKSFEDMAIVGGAGITFSADARARGRNMQATLLGSNAFGVLGVRPAQGRDFVPVDEAPGAPPVVILSYAFRETLGAREIVGHTVWINKAPATVIGVMPEGFEFPEVVDLWMPMEHTAKMVERTPGEYMAFGRLKDGVTRAGGRTEIREIGRRLAEAYPATNRDVTPRVDTYAEFFVGPDATMIYGSLWAAAWLVLLIACANLANLALARTVGRYREFATRMALGAGRARMVRQILTESLTLAAAGAVAGWWIAKWSVQTFAAATASRFEVLDYSINQGTLMYLAAISSGAAILCAIVPAAAVFRLDVNHSLKGDARGVTRSAGARRVSAVLVTGQMALAIVLLAGAGVLVRSFLKVVNADVGVRDPEHVLTAWVGLPDDKYPSAESRVGFFDLLTQRLMAIPGAETATLASDPPGFGGGSQLTEIEGGPEGRQSVITLTTGSDYLRTLGATLRAGREFNDADRAGSGAVAIVNQRFAEMYWPGKNPLGMRVRESGTGGLRGDWRMVVGVASNILQDDSTRQRFPAIVYVPFRQAPAASANFFLRTKVPPARLAGAVRETVRGLDSDIEFEHSADLKSTFRFDRSRMDIAHAEMEKHAAVAPIFAGVALLLAAIGLYAVMARSVGERTQEIGVRMALGASPREIRGLLFRQGMRPVGIGLIPGLLAAPAVMRLLQSQLVGVSPYDPATLAGTVAVLILAALAGCWLPANRAIRVDPAVALRQE